MISNKFKIGKKNEKFRVHRRLSRIDFSEYKTIPFILILSYYLHKGFGIRNLKLITAKANFSFITRVSFSEMFDNMNE